MKFFPFEVYFYLKNACKSDVYFCQPEPENPSEKNFFRIIEVFRL